ncbi:hypothetical protein V6N11_054285 [Hibiscus sabdariffa]|uniref:RRM domain-containing protein n=1 Tax=Hibiscus sabdariffa TaxID=183260 RepID=A0ABR2S4D3_9ROSI
MEKTEFDNNIQEVVSLFVENLPETLHWKGLWFSFARHGDVVNAYIARKRCRGGKRFGFVRMKNPEEADVFQVSVREVGFHDGTSYPLCNNGNSEMADSEKIDESTSTSKSDMVRSKSENEVDWNRPGMEEEEIQARWVERNCINGDSWDNETSRGHIKFSELVGGLPKDTGALDGVGIGEGCGLEARPCENFDPLSGLASYGKGRIAESNSVVNLDLDPKEHAGGVANGQKKPWAERINEKVNLGYIHGRYPIEDDILEDESDRGKGTKEEG